MHMQGNANRRRGHNTPLPLQSSPRLSPLTGDACTTGIHSSAPASQSQPSVVTRRTDPRCVVTPAGALARVALAAAASPLPAPPRTGRGAIPLPTHGRHLYTLV